MHDDVLGQMALLVTQSASTDSPEFQERYQEVVGRLRQMVSQLRPPVLQFSLHLALEDLADALAEKFEGQAELHFEISESNSGYGSAVDEQLYRIVQQACENAFRHAQAQNIRVSGSLEPGRVELTVADDGIGFQLERLDFTTLLAEKHFGLAGMFERADLIGAELAFASNPSQGTTVTVSWEAASTEEK